MNNIICIFGIVLCIASATEVYAARIGKTLTVYASHYGAGDGFDGQTTANCTVFRATGKTAAHKTLPLGTRVELKNPKTGHSETVTITDRGPYVKGRDLDVASIGVGKPLKVGAKTQLEMCIISIPDEPVYGNACSVAKRSF